MNQHVCRCCLLENPTDSHNIFDTNLHFDLLQFLPNVNIEPDDGLPEILCNNCLKRLNETLEFRRRCEDADRELRKRFEETNLAIDEALRRIDQDVYNFIENTSLAIKQLEKDGDLLDDHQEIGELDVFNELLLEDISFSSLSDTNSSTTESESIINELLNKALADSTFDKVSTIADGAYSDINGNQNFSCSNNNLLEQNSTSNDYSINSSINANSSVQVNKNEKIKRTHPCPQCDKSFTRNFQLKLHMTSVHKISGGLQYTCTDCYRTFASSHSLKYHRKSTHTNERPFACTLCDKSFVLKTQLASHMNVHTGVSRPRIFECEHCGKTWPTKSDLRTHMRSHDPNVVRPFQCTHCEKRFYTRGHLTSHLLVHTGQKPFACSYCERAYQSVGNLNHHIMRRHKNEKLVNV